MNGELKNGDTIWEVDYCRALVSHTIKDVKKEGMIVSARIVCEKGGGFSNLVCGHKNSDVLSGVGTFYSEKISAEYILNKQKYAHCIENLLYRIECLGINFTTTSTEIVNAINKQL